MEVHQRTTIELVLPVSGRNEPSPGASSALRGGSGRWQEHPFPRSTARGSPKKRVDIESCMRNKGSPKPHLQVPGHRCHHQTCQWRRLCSCKMGRGHLPVRKRRSPTAKSPRLASCFSRHSSGRQRQRNRLGRVKAFDLVAHAISANQHLPYGSRCC
ncbi:uncharacterized protein LOC141747949 isoform X3 [Larus michahellis]|uniref:uncharacterized protein LOC141747949 isoform X3 n=1 Tax=Larus michahellis TaxID=119627 RepID=UPI003D9B0D73